MAVNSRCSFLEVSEYIQVCRTIMLTMIKKSLIKAFKINEESVSMSSQRPFPCREKGLPHSGAAAHAPLCYLFFQVWDLSLTIPGPAPPVSHLSTGTNSSRAWAELSVFAGCYSLVTGPAVFLSSPEASWSKKLWIVPGRNSGFVLHLANDSPVREATGFPFRGCSGNVHLWLWRWPQGMCAVTVEISYGGFSKVKIELPYDPAAPLLSIGQRPQSQQTIGRSAHPRSL